MNPNGMNVRILSSFRVLTISVVLPIILYALVLSEPNCCYGGGILHVFPPTFQQQAFAVARPTILLSRTEVTVSEKEVTYRSEQTFFNDNEFPLEGVFLFPLGDDRSGLKPEVRVNGVPQPADVVASNEFFPMLREYTMALKDPSLLALAGKAVLIIKPINIGVRQQKTFRVEFHQPSCIKDNQCEMVLPLDGERYSLGPVRELEILVRFKLSRPLRTIFSPSHHLSVSREAPHRCLVSCRSESKRIREDFRILATFSGQNVDLRLFPEFASDQKGAFMAFVAPPLLAAAEKEPEKDVVFLMDCSGSIGPANLALSKQVITAGLERLRPGDRFNILTFGTRIGSMADRLVPADNHTTIKAVRFLNTLVAEGGSDLYNGIAGSLEQFTTRKRPGIVLMVGHGRPTVGVISPDSIIENLRRVNRLGARIFALSLGDKTDLTFLDKIAQITRGKSFQVSGKEPLPEVVNGFLAGISPPSVSQISLNFQGMTIRDVIPDPLPDLFSDESIILFGFFDEFRTGDAKVTLKAKERSRPQALVSKFMFPSAQSIDRRYVTEIWAMRQMAALLERERFKGPERGNTEKMAVLARKFGFKLPSAEPGSPSDTGELFWQFKTSLVPEDVASDLARRVQGRVFYREGSTWIDVECQNCTPARTVHFLHDEYFALLHERPQLGNFFALGPEVLLAQPGGALRVTAASRPGSNSSESPK